MDQAIELPVTLQVALLLASIAIVVFVAYCLPALHALRQNAQQLTRSLEELKAEVSSLIKDGRHLLHSVNELTTRANQQCDDVQEVIHTVRDWAARVDRIVTGVSSALAPPVLIVAHQAQAIRKGFTRFLDTFLHRNQQQPQQTEVQHVRE